MLSRSQIRTHFRVALVVASLGSSSPRAQAQAPDAVKPAADGAAGWAKLPIVDLPKDTAQDNALFVGNRVCVETLRRVRLRCWDVNSGASKVTYEEPTPSGAEVSSAGYALNGGRILLGYQVGKELWLREVDLETGTARRALTVPVDDDSHVRVKDFKLYGASLIFRFATKKGSGWEGQLRKINLQNGQIEDQISLPFAADAWDLASDVVFVGRLDRKATEIQGYDLSNGKKLFSRSFGTSFVHGVAAGPHELFVEFDKELLRLDERTGKTTDRAAVDKQGNSGPRVRAGQVYVCASGLQVFGLTLTPIAHIARANEWVIDCDVRDDYAWFRSNQEAHLVDLRKQVVLASIDVRGDRFIRALGSFDGRGLPFIEGTTTPDGSEKLGRVTQLAAEPFTVVGLPAAAVLLENGVPPPLVLSHGKHHFEVFRSGFRPARVELEVRPPAARLDLKGLRYEAAPAVPVVNGDTFPADLELTDVPKLASRSEHHFAYGSHGSLADTGRRIALDAQGLFARSMRTGREDWMVPLAQIQAQSGLKDSGGAGTFELFAVLPGARLALVGSRAHAASLLLAYDLDTGQLRWQVSSDLASPPHADEYYFNAATEYGGLFWYRSDNALYGRDLRDGRLAYFYQFGNKQGLWGAPVFHADRAFIVYDKELIGLDLTQRSMAFRTPVSGRGYLTLGVDAASLLFVDDNEVRSISFTGAALARSPRLGGQLAHAPAIVKTDAIYVCSGLKTSFYALDPQTLKLRWSFTNHTGQAPCPMAFSAQQVAATDNHKTVIVERQTGKLLLEGADLLPSARYLHADGSGVCLLERKGSVCLDR